MKVLGLGKVLYLGLLLVFLTSCSGESPVDLVALKSKPQTYVGTDTCKMCHLEHYDSWKMTLHSRMLGDAQKNTDAIVAEIDEKKIREDLAKIGDKLKVPADKVYIPKSKRSNTPSAASGSSATWLKRRVSSTSPRSNTMRTPTAG